MSLHDYSTTVECYFQILSESHARLIDVINASPIEIVNFGDNVHAGVLSPRLFLRYVLPEYQKRNELLHLRGSHSYPLGRGHQAVTALCTGRRF